MIMNKLNSFLGFLVALLLAVGCTPDNPSNNDPVQADVRLTTYDPVEIGTRSAVCGGDAIVVQGLSLTELGICWSTHDEPTIDDPHASTPQWNENYVFTITGLEMGTKYYVRVYALRGTMYYYGEVKSFTTLNNAILPKVESDSVSQVMWTSALAHYTMIDDGGDELAVHGVCWGTEPNPTMEGFETYSGLGSFSVPMEGLTNGKTYYVRAFASNGIGISYGNELIFTTLYGIPTVTTNNVISISHFSAVGGGQIVDDGLAEVTECGLCWSTNVAPTINDNHCVCESVEPQFSIIMDNLEESTTYYVRAYAINDYGIAYGNEVNFTTKSAPIAPEGSVNGLFSIAYNKQVWFSKGNLQFQASTSQWRFAENQYDCIGDDNTQIASDYSGWIDLFGWGTSGYNHGSVCFVPWSTSDINPDYNAYGKLFSNLNDETGQADWGYNAISNGGNSLGFWRTLSRSEWNYVMFTRETVLGIRFAKAWVGLKRGIVLLPDDWLNEPHASVNDYNQTNASFHTNYITEQDWHEYFEPRGAVFLPVSGNRKVTTVSKVNNGYYWTSSVTSYDLGQMATLLFFDDSKLTLADQLYGKSYGVAVRLVHDY